MGSGYVNSNDPCMYAARRLLIAMWGWTKRKGLGR